MAKPDFNLRLFVAVYPPQLLAKAWAQQIRSMDLPEYRMTPVEQIHLTLQFVADVPIAQLDHTIESCRRAVKGLSVFTLTPQRFITLPERGRSRLISIETNAPPTLLELKRRLASRLARNVRENPAKRFRPHLTICRFRTPEKVGEFDSVLSGEEFEVNEIVVMRSTLTPHGAKHEAVANVSLD